MFEMRYIPCFYGSGNLRVVSFSLRLNSQNRSANTTPCVPPVIAFSYFGFPVKFPLCLCLLFCNTRKCHSVKTKYFYIQYAYHVAVGIGSVSIATGYVLDDRRSIPGSGKRLFLFHNLYSLPSIIRMIKSTRMRWVGNVARMREKNAYRILMGKPEGKTALGRPRRM
jgi:hypothetical protein